MPASWSSEEHTSELQSRENLVCRLLLEKKKIQRADASFLQSDNTSRYDDLRGSLVHLHHQAIALRRADQAGRRDREGLGFFFNDTATTEIYTLSLHDALPI